ncbi:MAG: hypothetical protein SW833_06215 [Cyanobacteriota bacterium]|nr:hypothetical protein [Cyanobacteriota bacterium]
MGFGNWDLGLPNVRGRGVLPGLQGDATFCQRGHGVGSFIVWS